MARRFAKVSEEEIEEAFFLYLKKAGFASRNIVHPQKRSFYVVSTTAFIFFILYVKPIRSLLIQRTPAGSSFWLFALTFYSFFYPSDLVNTKTTIPLRVGEERWIYTSTLRFSVYIHHYSPPLRGIVLYYPIFRKALPFVIRV